MSQTGSKHQTPITAIFGTSLLRPQGAEQGRVKWGNPKLRIVTRPTSPSPSPQVQPAGLRLPAPQGPLPSPTPAGQARGLAAHVATGPLPLPPHLGGEGKCFASYPMMTLQLPNSHLILPADGSLRNGPPIKSVEVPMADGLLPKPSRMGGRRGRRVSQLLDEFSCRFA